MDINEFRAMKESGGTVADAALQEEVLEEEEFEEEHQEEEEEALEEQEEEVQEEEDDIPPLPPKEQTAFEKRMAREKAKLEEKLRQEIEAAAESKYRKHREAIEALGGDPDKLLKAAAESKMLKEIQGQAKRLADQNGWSDEDEKWYVDQQMQQQKQDAELKELRVQMQINRLRDNPEYAGIATMEREILQKIDKSNGALSVEEAYWALGGSRKAEQIKLEAQQREIAKRSKTPRTVVKDSPSNTTGEKPIPESVLREAKLMGISEAEARRLMNSKASADIDSWREERRKAKGG